MRKYEEEHYKYENIKEKIYPWVKRADRQPGAEWEAYLGKRYAGGIIYGRPVGYICNQEGGRCI